MKELFRSTTVRFIIYLAISILSMTTTYGVFFLTSVYHRNTENRALITEIQKEMASRKEYVQRFEKVEAIQKTHGDLLHRIMDRQADTNKAFDKRAR